MLPGLPLTISPEQAVELIKRMGLPTEAAPSLPLSAARNTGLPLGTPNKAPPVVPTSQLYSETPRPLGRPEPNIMGGIDNSTAAAALMMMPPAIRAAGVIARPALELGKRAITASPMTTAAATGTTAATLPSATGVTPWETMQNQWGQRRSALDAQIAEQQAALEEARQAHLARAPREPQRPQATANKQRGQNALELYERAMSQYPGLVKQHQDALGPVLAPFEERLTGLRGQIAGIDEEIKNSQTPIREKNPMLGVLAPPLAWTAAALTGGKLGKFARGLQESRATALTGAAERGAEQIARGRSAFTGPQGRASAAELQAAEGKGVAPLFTPAAAGTTGAVVGAAEGALAPLGLSAIDAISAPGGSPLGMAAAEAPYTVPFWMQAFPEMAVAGGASGLAATLAALRRPGGGRFAKPQFGPPSAPTDQIRGMAAAARSAPAPKPKPKPKAEE